MRKCRKCGIEINDDVANRVKVVGKENKSRWIMRHVRQLFSLLIHGFIKPEIEDYIELCDACFQDVQKWLGLDAS